MDRGTKAKRPLFQIKRLSVRVLHRQPHGGLRDRLKRSIGYVRLPHLYDEKFPTKKDIIGEINMGLDHIQQDVKCGCAPYGFEVILDAALYAYDSPRSKLEGEEAEPTGDHSACVILATLTAEDVARELKEKETEEANRLTQRFCADPTFDALCTRYPTLRLDPYDPHSSDYRDMVKLRKLYEERTGKPAFQ